MIRALRDADIGAAGKMHGAVAQLGERRVRNAKVEGSIPFRSTNTQKPTSLSSAFLLPETPAVARFRRFLRRRRLLPAPSDRGRFREVSVSSLCSAKDRKAAIARAATSQRLFVGFSAPHPAISVTRPSLLRIERSRSRISASLSRSAARCSLVDSRARSSASRAAVRSINIEVGGRAACAARSHLRAG